MSQNQGDDDLKVSCIFTRSFKCTYSVIGVSFTKCRSKCSFIFATLMLLRVSISFLLWIIQTDVWPRPVIIINEIAYQLIPLVEFILLASSLPKFNREIERYFNKLNMRMSEDLVNSMKTLNRWCVFFILMQFTLTAGLQLNAIKVPRNWMVKRTFPVETPLGPLAENIIGHLSMAYETYLKNYIPLSVCLYLCYYKLLIVIKNKVLADITVSTSCRYIFKRLHELNKFFNSFETTFSILPLSWLAYSIGPGLSYALHFPPLSGDWATFVRKIAFLIRVLWNFLALLLILYLISRWQCRVDSTVDSIALKMEINVQSIVHSRVVDRITRVMRRRVTVWGTCPIEKMLILSFIGSALTFSVFFLQLSA